MLHALPQPQISFLYLGQFEQTSNETPLFTTARESAGASRSARAMRRHLLDIYAHISQGRLQVDWKYSENLHHRTTIERLADSFVRALRTTIGHCLTTRSAFYSPSDFPGAHINQDELDKIIAQAQSILETLLIAVHDIEDIYQLSPMQQGILFQTLISRVGRVHHSSELYARRKCEPHGVRTGLAANASAAHDSSHSFYWKGLEKPMQVVRRKVNLPLEKLDWRGVSPSAVASELEEYQQAEQRRGFNLERAGAWLVSPLVDSNVKRSNTTSSGPSTISCLKGGPLRLS